MLISLSIRNTILIKSLQIAFKEGLCTLTGETGAGKSILLDSLGLALGNRAASGIVRQGEKQGIVVAEFDISGKENIQILLEEQGISNSNNILLLRRVLYADGKSKSFANDEPVGLPFLQKLSGGLIEICGQHNQRGLLNPSNHIKILDNYGQLENNTLEVERLYRDWKECENRLEKTRIIAEKAQKDEDYLRHVFDELSLLDIKESEEEILAEKRTLLTNQEKIIKTLQHALHELTEKSNIESGINAAERILIRSGQSNFFESVLESLDRAGVEINEAISEIEKIAENLNPDQDTLENLEERLFAIRAAARKYKRPSGELSLYANEIREQLSLIENYEGLLFKLEKAVEETFSIYVKNASYLTKKRQKVITKLESRIHEELSPVKMAECKFKVLLNSLPEGKFSPYGLDDIIFVVKTNPETPFGQLHKIASGGELSRFMLALKIVLSEASSVPSVIFDEIDTGIGGSTANAVGGRLAKLAENIQVLCVTHQPQVASHGKQHLKVRKENNAGKTYVIVEELSEIESHEEIARMLAGAIITDEARAAARKLIRQNG